jgi:LacI family transcriptional regulator
LPPRSKITIADVARTAGVSPMTVSRVINDPEAVTEGRRRLVLQAIEALHYSPNPAARALAGGKPVRLALFYDNPSTAYLSTFLLGSLEAAQRQHAQLTVIRCQSGAEKEPWWSSWVSVHKGFCFLHRFAILPSCTR